MMGRIKTMEMGRMKRNMMMTIRMMRTSLN